MELYDHQPSFDPESKRMFNRRVLVVDDEPLVLKLFESALRSESELQQEFGDLFISDEAEEKIDLSFHLVTVESGEAGVMEVTRAVAQKNPFAVAFMDVNLPGGIDGVEASRQIREIDPDIHIVIVSGDRLFVPSQLRAVLFSHLYFLRKPIDAAEVEHMAYNACLNWNRNRQLRQELNNNIAYRHWLTQLLDALPMVVTVIDVESYQVLLHSGQMVQEEGHHCYRLLYGRQTPCAGVEGECPLRQVVENREQVVQERIEAEGSDRERSYEMHCVPIIPHDGSAIQQVMEFSIDITARRQRLLEKESMVRQQRQLFNTFRSTAHTMKNSIGYLNGIIELVDGAAGNPGVLDELFSTERTALIREQIEMIHTLIQLALGNARESSRRPQPLRVRQRVEEVLSLFALSSLGKGREVVLQGEIAEDSAVLLSAIDFQTVLMNLLNNGAEAVDQFLTDLVGDGSLENLVQLQQLQAEPMLFLRMAVTTSSVTIELHNRGHAIPEEMLETIFLQGASGKEQGNGVGLYDVRQILRQAGGVIGVANVRGGVTFSLSLPLVSDS